jgi:hypothetical protein
MTTIIYEENDALSGTYLILSSNRGGFPPSKSTTLLSINELVVVGCFGYAIGPWHLV